MDCDQVFMILTRGPFPSGDPTDEGVEEHLETCADCWRLAEALRPALEVFQEAVPPVEGRDLPGYWGDARPAATVVTRLTNRAARLAPAAGVLPMARLLIGIPREPFDRVLSGNVIRALVLVSALTAAMVSVVLWLRG